MAISKIKIGNTEHELQTTVDNIIDLTTATTSTAGLMSAADKTKLGVTNIAYGTCSTAAATAAKVVTISGNDNWELTAGSIIVVKFTATNTASNPTFNVNGTGAKPVAYGTANITTSSLSYAGYANRYIEYMYNGSSFVFIGWSYDANSTYTNASLGQGYGTCSTAEATLAKTVAMSSYALTKWGIVVVKFTYAVPANSTLNINSKGAKSIYWKGAAITDGVIKAGDTAAFIYDGTQYQCFSIDVDTSNLVTLDGDQTITGKKVFDTNYGSQVALVVPYMDGNAPRIELTADGTHGGYFILQYPYNMVNDSQISDWKSEFYLPKDMDAGQYTLATREWSSSNLITTNTEQDITAAKTMKNVPLYFWGSEGEEVEGYIDGGDGQLGISGTYNIYLSAPNAWFNIGNASKIEAEAQGGMYLNNSKVMTAADFTYSDNVLTIKLT